MWFRELVGFDEISSENVREKITIDEEWLISKVNGKSFRFGSLEIPTLSELKEQAPPVGIFDEKLQLTEVVADVQTIHCDEKNKNALIQAASQFNLLEMMHPQITPERGIDRYEHDRTQGPACAIACGAGTIYRNYFVPLNNQQGQTADNQINCLELIEKDLNNNELLLWKMINGYAILNKGGLINLNSQLSKLNHNQREKLKENLKIGIQWNTEVTIANPNQVVSQAYCSALPVAYSNVDAIYCESFARVILEACYEATLYAALINLQKTNCNKVFLTLVGGGAFGNETDWILESLILAVNKFQNTPLEVAIVSYGKPNQKVQELLQKH